MKLDKQTIEKGLMIGALSFFGGLIAQNVWNKIIGGNNGTI